VDGMSEEPKKRSRVWIGWTLLALVVLYPLSIGPAWYVCTRTDGWWVFSVYRPLFWICKDGALQSLLVKYLGLWSPVT
jgi:hypothetical protein